MRKALVIADINETGGTGSYFYRLLEYLSSRFALHVVLKRGKVGKHVIAWLAAQEIVLSTDLVLLPRLDDFLTRLFRRAGLLEFYAYARDALIRERLGREYSPDIFVISQGGGLRYFAFLNGRKPAFLISHSLFDQSFGEGLFNRVYIRLYRRLDPVRTSIVVVSEYAQKLFTKNIRSEPISRCVVCIPNYGDTARPQGGERGEKLRILTLGHVISYKNPLLWLEVACRITERYPGRAEFIWAGDGELLEEMRERSRNSDTIRFLGFIKDVTALYESADIYFQPSQIESQGISVIEAMAWAIPCVVSDAGGLPESIEDEREGYVCEVMAVEQYVEALSRLIVDESKRRELGKAAHAKYLERFSKERWTARMDTIFESLPFEDQHEDQRSWYRLRRARHGDLPRRQRK